MAGFKEFTISFLLVGFFFFAIINFGVQMATDNDNNVSIIDNPSINKSFSKLNGSLIDIQSTAESNKETFFQGEIKETDSGLGIIQTVKIARTMSVGFLSAMFFTLGEFISGALGLNPLIYAVFVAIFILTFIYLIIKLLRTGT